MRRRALSYLWSAQTDLICREVMCISRLGLVLVVIILSALTHTASAQTVGISLPFGGEYAPLAKQFQRGINLALELEGKPEALEVFFVDDGCDPEIGALAVDDLESRSPDLVAGFLCNAPALLAAKTFRDSNVPVLIGGARSERLLKDGQKEAWNIWRIAPGDAAAPVFSASIIAALWKELPFALVDDGSIYARNYVDRMRIELEELGAPPQVLDTFRAAQSTQAGLLRRLQRTGIKAIFVAAAAAEDLMIIGENINSFELEFEYAASEALAVLPFVENASNVVAGTLVIAQQSPLQFEPASKLADLLAEREIDPALRIFEGYAMTQVILASLGATPGVTKQRLSTREFQTVLGPVRFSSEGRNVHHRYKLNRWDGEKLGPVEVDLPAPDATQ